VALLSAVRPAEWIKNLLVFAGLLFSQQFDDPAAVLDATLTFVAFCSISSAGYLVNDLRDAPFDRRHPEKRNRAIASGALPASTAWTAAIVLGVAALALPAAAVSLGVAALVAIYGVVTIAYSLILKRLVILDVMTIASLFILRVVAGAEAVDAHASEWLLVCTGMLALFLGFTKRRQEAMQELDASPDSGGTTRPVLEHYSIPFLDQMVAMVTAAAVISYAVYAVDSPNIGSEMLATLPSVLYGIFRYLYLMYMKNGGGSPEDVLIKDVPFLANAVLWMVTAVAILYIFPT
jgi:4-hydroxybenzoate polyprenyltransferase